MIIVAMRRHHYLAFAQSRGQFLQNAALGLNRKQKADDAPNREDSAENNEYVVDAIISDHPSDQQGSDGRRDAQPRASEARTNSAQAGGVEFCRIEVE